MDLVLPSWLAVRVDRSSETLLSAVVQLVAVTFLSGTMLLAQSTRQNLEHPLAHFWNSFQDFNISPL